MVVHNDVHQRNTTQVEVSLGLTSGYDRTYSLAMVVNPRLLTGRHVDSSLLPHSISANGVTTGVLLGGEPFIAFSFILDDEYLGKVRKLHFTVRFTAAGRGCGPFSIPCVDDTSGTTLTWVTAECGIVQGLVKATHL